MFVHQILGNLSLPLVSVREKLFLVVKQFFMCLTCELEIRAFHNGIDGASLLTESAIDTLGHVNVVASSSAGTILTFLHFDRNGLGGAGGFTELASNASFLSGGVTAQSVLSTEAGAQITLLEGIVDGHLGLHKDFTRQPKGACNFGNEEHLGGIVKYLIPWSLTESKQSSVRNLIQDDYEESVRWGMYGATGTYGKNIILLLLGFEIVPARAQPSRSRE
jgi:hypothetical protein